MKKLLWLAVLLAGAAQAAPIPFATYIRLHNGMQEAELISKAGAPDYANDGPQTKSVGGNGTVTVDSTRVLTWLANDQLPYTTTVTVKNGVVTDISRSKKL
ncbi:hypothetical protein [Chromobacterium amazonense]|uniref:hypothetical protein n=1 Tax=Chromobacterium amazonense TaxID=1382803 RepID=UPI003F7A504E